MPAISTYLYLLFSPLPALVPITINNILSTYSSALSLLVLQHLEHSAH